jgi:predicted ATP-dependent endonuclease of OLD family
MEIAELFSVDAGGVTGSSPSTSFGQADAERLKRFVERPFGELLFATLIVLGDGATERAFLPLVIRAALPDISNGVTVIDPESMGSPNAKAALKLANQVVIPWLVFADSDRAGVQDSTALLNDYGGGDTSKRIYVADPASRTGGYDFEAMILEFDSAMCERACSLLGFDGTLTIESFLDQNKGVFGALLAEEFLSSYPPEVGLGTWPVGLRELIEAIERELRI